jgi:prophage regulatory protein
MLAQLVRGDTYNFAEVRAVTMLLRLPEVMRAVGLRKSTLYQLIRSQSFPAQIRLTKRAVAWRAEDIERWIQSRKSPRS